MNSFRLPFPNGIHYSLPYVLIWTPQAGSRIYRQRRRHLSEREEQRRRRLRKAPQRRGLPAAAPPQRGSVPPARCPVRPRPAAAPLSRFGAARLAAGGTSGRSRAGARAGRGQRAAGPEPRPDGSCRRGGRRALAAVCGAGAGKWKGSGRAVTGRDREPHGAPGFHLHPQTLHVAFTSFAHVRSPSCRVNGNPSALLYKPRFSK